MSDKPIWLLDVDGVINASDPGWPLTPHQLTPKGKLIREAPRSASVSAGWTSFKLRWSPMLILRIKRIIASDLVNVVWATTWIGHTGNLERLWGLPPLESAWIGERFGLSASRSKRDAAIFAVESGYPLIWTDDMEVPIEGDLYDHLMGNDNALLIRPDDRHGLRPWHLDAIEAFIGLNANADV